MATSASDVDIDANSCSICKDIYKDPVKISCGHTFCEDCVKASWKTMRDDPICPVCRKLTNGEMKVDVALLTKMAKKSTPCKSCTKVLILTEYRRHEKMCRGDPFGASTSGTSRFSYSEDVKPNIYTFSCPYCLQKNLDRQSLLIHVKEQHKGDQTKIVCPVCKVMPWGNEQQYSQDFHQHLNLRHQFDYDRFTDLNQDDDSCLESAMKISVRQY